MKTGNDQYTPFFLVIRYTTCYTQTYIKISSFKSLIYINYFYIFTEILILKAILVFLKLMQLI
jgi:hypothetical protein